MHKSFNATNSPSQGGVIMQPHNKQQLYTVGSSLYNNKLSQLQPNSIQIVISVTCMQLFVLEWLSQVLSITIIVKTTRKYECNSLPAVEGHHNPVLLRIQDCLIRINFKCHVNPRISFRYRIEYIPE